MIERKKKKGVIVYLDKELISEIDRKKNRKDRSAYLRKIITFALKKET
jgi:hypothetical protein